MANQRGNNKKTPAPLILSRRGFLRGAASLGGAAALVGIHGGRSAQAAEDFTGNQDRFGVLTDVTKCIGCRLCEQACAKAHDLPAPNLDPAVMGTTRRTSAQAFTVVNKYVNPAGGIPIFRKQQCMHCDEPACASACLVGALKKTKEGPVVYNEDVCIGCRYCMIACPYSIPTYEFGNATTPKIRKCIMCYDRLERGEIPACAAICPPKATIFGKRSDLLKEARHRILDDPNKYVNQIYGETEAGGSGWLYLSSVPFDKLALPTNLGRKPYPEYTREFLLSVPLVLMMWPTALAGVNALIKRRERLDGETAAKTETKEEVRR